VIFGLVIGIGAVAGFWVWLDASKRDWPTAAEIASRRGASVFNGPIQWGIATFLVWVFVLPWYLVAREKAPLRKDPRNAEKPPVD
jgi:hypothetical protein